MSMKRKDDIRLAFLSAVPAIKPKGPKPGEASLGIFSWIANNFPWVISGIAVALIVAAIIRTTRDRARYRKELERRDRAAGNK